MRSLRNVTPALPDTFRDATEQIIARFSRAPDVHLPRHHNVKTKVIDK